MTSLRQIFKRYPNHELIELGWHEHSAFVDVVASMDMVLQVSNTETFNIVAADAVAHHVPVVVSNEIPWLDGEFTANPNSVIDIVNKTLRVWRGSGNGLVQADQRQQLCDYVHRSKHLWGEFLES